jgi:putative copper export protein
LSEAAASTPLIALHALSASVWVGGLVAIFVVARVAAATLDPPARVAFFRTFGRTYGVVGSVALMVGLVTGALLLRGHRWDGLLVATAIVAGALLVATAVGMAQARAMTGLRRRALTGAGGAALDPRIRRGAALAGALRATIALLTVTLVVLGAALAG